MKEDTEVDLKITVYTDYHGENKQERARIRIEQTSHHLSALFWFIRKAAEGYSLLDLQTDTKLFSFGEFRENIQPLCALGIGLSNELTLYSVQTEAEKLKAETTAEAAPDSAEEIRRKNAVTICELLKNMNLPDEFYNAIVDGFEAICDFGDYKTLKNLEKSPDYVESVLRDYEAAKKEKQD